MKLLRELWRDDRGVILSAEAVLVGTVAVIGITVGLKAVARSVNDELTDVACAIRSIDQSYSFRGQRGCGAWTAGSCFRQAPVRKSLAELRCFIADEERRSHEDHHSRDLRDHERDGEHRDRRPGNPEWERHPDRGPDRRERDALEESQDLDDSAIFDEELDPNDVRPEVVRPEVLSVPSPTA